MQQDTRSRKDRQGNQTSDVATTQANVSLMDEPTLETLSKAGIDIDELQSFVSSLSEDQLFTLLQMDIDGLGTQIEADDAEIARGIREKYPELSEEQILQFAALNKRLLRVEGDEDFPY